MTAIHVTQHAVDRYIERIAPVSQDEARAALSRPAISAAVKFGARVVRLERGRVILGRAPDGGAAVITVVPLDKRYPPHRSRLDRRDADRGAPWNDLCTGLMRIAAPRADEGDRA